MLQSQELLTGLSETHKPGRTNTHSEGGKNDLINSSAEPQDTWVFNYIGQSSLERMKRLDGWKRSEQTPLSKAFSSGGF